MAKRIITRIGDVFCFEVRGQYKRYFQYICDDLTMLNSSVIRVFRSRYPIEYIPVLENIINDNVDFYAHTVLRDGIEENVWYKIGKTKNLLSSDINNIIWGRALEFKHDESLAMAPFDPMKNWSIWRTNEPMNNIGILPSRYYNKIEYGVVKSFEDIVNRMTCGYYKYTSPVYDIIKRIPYPDVDSYTRKEFENRTVWSHFRGEFVVQEIAVKEDGETILPEGNPLDRPKFWQTNWEYKELISEEEFNKVWNRSVK